jgi:hypothetical protein
MRRSPSIVPDPDDRDIYLVLDDFGGRLGRAWPETDEERTDREIVITDLMTGQYSNPVRVVAFNTAEGWSRATGRLCRSSFRCRCAGRLRLPAGFAFRPWNAYHPGMPRKAIQLPPEVARAFIRDLKAFFAEENPTKRDEIAIRQMSALRQYQGPREKPVRIPDIMEMFRQMRDDA